MFYCWSLVKRGINLHIDHKVPLFITLGISMEEYLRKIGKI